MNLKPFEICRESTPGRCAEMLAAFLSGSCNDGTGLTITVSMVFFLPPGLVINLRAWPASTAPADDPPFGPQFDVPAQQGSGALTG